MPTGSDASSDETSSEEDDDEEGKVTGKNILARAKALDAKLAREAELDAAELREAAAAEDDEEFADVEMADDDDEEGAAAPDDLILTAQEREEEKQRGGPDLQTVQRRMRACVRILGNFAKLGNGRYV